MASPFENPWSDEPSTASPTTWPSTSTAGIPVLEPETRLHGSSSTEAEHISPQDEAIPGPSQKEETPAFTDAASFTEQPWGAQESSGSPWANMTPLANAISSISSDHAQADARDENIYDSEKSPEPIPISVDLSLEHEISRPTVTFTPAMISPQSPESTTNENPISTLQADSFVFNHPISQAPSGSEFTEFSVDALSPTSSAFDSISIDQFSSAMSSTQTQKLQDHELSAFDPLAPVVESVPTKKRLSPPHKLTKSLSSRENLPQTTQKKANTARMQKQYSARLPAKTTAHISSPVVQQTSKTSAIQAIFVARFDTLRGNVIEFVYPPGLDLTGLEFTCLPSGSHAVSTDIIYFRRDELFGVSVFKREMVLDSSLSKTAQNIAANERGARVRSIGMLTTHPDSLHEHIPFLHHQAEIYILEPLPILADALTAYFHIINDGGALPVPVDSNVKLPSVVTPSIFLREMVRNLGPSIFTVWKYSLLRNRILFFSPPPVQNACLSVLATGILTHHDVPLLQTKQNPLHYITIADIPILMKYRLGAGGAKPVGYESGYIAATSDAIFETKTDLWDLYVHPSGKLSFPKHRPVYKHFGPNSADISRYQYLTDLIDRSEAGETVVNQRYLQRGEEKTALLDDVEGTENIVSPSDSTQASGADLVRAASRITNYFHHLTTRLLSTLLLLTHTPSEAILTAEDVRALDMDPEEDRMFLMDVCDSLGVSVVIKTEEKKDWETTARDAAKVAQRVGVTAGRSVIGFVGDVINSTRS